MGPYLGTMPEPVLGGGYAPIPDVIPSQPTTADQLRGFIRNPFVEMAGGLVPGVSEAIDAKDLIEGYFEGDKLKMGLAGAGLAIPFLGGFGGMVKAYHGTPHKFDAFDAGKIGTGEGSQAFGHGLYFAENPNVARSYIGNADGRFARMSSKMDPKTEFAYDFLDNGYSDLQVMEKLVQKYDGISFDETQEIISKAKEFKPGGALYNVDIDVEPEDLLDWDAPLSEQSEKVRRD